MTADVDRARSWTPNELADRLRVAPDKIRNWIKTGALRAIDTGVPGRPRFVIPERFVQEFEQAHAAVPIKPRRGRKRTDQIDFFPDL